MKTHAHPTRSGGIFARMRLDKKILLVTVLVTFVSLAASSAVSIQTFRKNYVDALTSGSFGLAYSLNDIVVEMLDLGLPLESLVGMDKRIGLLVRQNPHIAYAAICDLDGMVIYHSDPTWVGKTIGDQAMRDSIAALQPLTQIYRRWDGHEYYDVTAPIFDVSKKHVGLTRLGFRTELVRDKVTGEILQTASIFLVSFTIVAALINGFLRHFISRRVAFLAAHASRLAEGHFDESVPDLGEDEIGVLAGSLGQMAQTIKSQMDALRRSHDMLEQQVAARTRELTESKDRLEAAASAGIIGIWDWDVVNNRLVWDKVMYRLYGVASEDFSGAYEAWAKAVHPEDALYVQQELAAAFRGERDYAPEFRILWPDGSIHHIKAASHTAFDDRGNPLRMTGVNYDLTEQKAAQQVLTKLNAELEQFAYVASHDLRQPLRMVTSYLSIISKRLNDRLDDEERKFISFAVDGAKRMDALILGLLEYSRIGKNQEPAAVPLSEVIREAVDNLAVAIAEAKAEVTIAADFPTVSGNRLEIMRLFQNLIANAVEYHAEDTRPVVAVSWTDGGKEWILSVRDNGIGIAPEHRERVFAIFQRLVERNRYEGTGIGLAVCRKIAEHHNGQIRVEDAPGGGCVFLVTLPKQL